jgi:hypothetical protein
MGHLYFGRIHFRLGYVLHHCPARAGDRAVSHYYFIRCDPSNYLYDSACKMSLKEFVESCDRQEPNNG